MLDGASRSRRTRRATRAALAGLGLALLVANPACAASVVSSIAVGGDDRSLEIDVTASGPLGYLLAESPEPFTLSLLFADASLGFPDERRTFAGNGLSELQASTLTREGKTLAKLDLTFARPVSYTVAREGSRVRVRAEVPGPTPPVVIGRAGDSSAPVAPPPAATRSEPAELRAVRPESQPQSARLVLDIEGTPTVRTFTMTHPDRVVVDLENARVAEKTRAVAAGGLLRGVRISQHTKTVVRVVCDLSRRVPFRVESVSSGLVIHLGEGVR